MPTIPPPVLDALQAVQADADDLAGKQAQAVSASAALSAAQQADQSAQAAVAVAQQHLAADLAALIDLERSAYGGTAQPQPPPAAVAAVKPSA